MAQEEKLFIFTLDSECCETNIQLDAEEELAEFGGSDEVVVGIYKGTYRQAKDQAVRYLMERFDVQKPEQEMNDENEDDEELRDEWSDYEDKQDTIESRLNQYELVIGGDHSTLILL